MKLWNLFDKKPHAGWGIAAGIAGGVVASLAMNLFLEGVAAAEMAAKTPEEKAEAEKQAASAGDDSTQKIANRLAEAVTHHELSAEGKKIGGPLVHYAFGGVVGAAYGLAAEYSEAAQLGMGSFFGAALFLAADEVMVPLLGMSAKPSEQPLASQGKYLMAHVVYGTTTELVRRGLRALVR